MSGNFGKMRTRGSVSQRPAARGGTAGWHRDGDAKEAFNAVKVCICNSRDECLHPIPQDLVLNVLFLE